MDNLKDIVGKVKAELTRAENNDGLCYYAANNICYDLGNANVLAQMLNIRDMAFVDYDHYFVLTDKNDEGKNCLIDLTFSQFVPKEGYKPIVFDNWPALELESSENGKAILNDLLKDGFTFVSDSEFYLYLKSFNPSFESFFTIDDIMSFKTR